MAWTTQKTWVTGEVLTAPDLNTYVRDDMNYLYNGRELASAGISGAQSIANNTTTYIPLAAESLDNANMHDPVTNNSRITLVNAGVYLALGSVAWAASAAGTIRQGQIRRNRTSTEAEITADPNGASAVVSYMVPALNQYSATDYLELAVTQDTGGALNVTAASMLVVRVS